MRWDSQRAGTDPQQALLGLDGLVRSVRSPEFAGVTFHEVRARSVLNRVPGESAVPFRWTVNPYRGCSHSCVYCLGGDTPVLMGDGRTKPLAGLEPGDQIYGTEDGRYVRTKVLAHWQTRKPAYRLRLADGTELVASGDHRFLGEHGWVHVQELRGGERLMGTGRFATAPEETAGYRAGYLAAMSGDNRRRLALGNSDVLDRTARYLAEAAATAGRQTADDWRKGFLAGTFDADGSCGEGTVRVTSARADTIEGFSSALEHFGFGFAVEGEGVRVVRLSGGLAEQLRFFHATGAATTRKLSLDGLPVEPGHAVASIEPLGAEEPLYDITTGTGDFIANGVVSHNCFARNTHTYLEFDAGHDFDTQVVVKINAPEVLATQLRRPGWQREHVAMGTNTDPYQRAEGRYQLMPGIIRALAGSGTPFSILTKGTTMSRDIPLLQAAAKQVDVGLGVSIALLDRELQRRVEPGTPSPQARLELVRRLRDAGLPCGVMIAPVLPGLTDSTEQLDELLSAVADAGATSATVLALHLRPGAREWYAQWLAREYPELVPRYREIYGRGSYAGGRYRRVLAARVGPLLRRHGFARDQNEAGHRVPEPREAAPAPEPEQMKLL
ncbi:intein-containing Rv2578c family radical SAM protein [Amycolatopsis acidiphila]|uniref:Radical SAM protein n=1 Tax=Amycolatopsis acidiphila TaxID=715473 RepID=A0A558A568_9PSEU|nr:intein-containing Rv2578c family radical SAM protein [Amycolatopsis acidiphila]TVT19429.1 radical SAM protein [Amycolatopsis acidiphila]UIJ56760.1 intein-containing Rv2578c family radical SAM protein [Amycolatopsis acidiphila]GHG55284.1 radical SAM protein [Amycolatopsis acidiphila]